MADLHFLNCSDRSWEQVVAWRCTVCVEHGGEKSRYSQFYQLFLIFTLENIKKNIKKNKQSSHLKCHNSSFKRFPVRYSRLTRIQSSHYTHPNWWNQSLFWHLCCLKWQSNYIQQLIVFKRRKHMKLWRPIHQTLDSEDILLLLLLILSGVVRLI